MSGDIATRVFVNETFSGFWDRNLGFPWTLRRSGRTFTNLEFRRCYFEGCTVSVAKAPGRRSVVRNVKLVDCEEAGCSLRAAIVEDMLVDGMKTSDLFITWGAVFKHVTLRGKLGRLMISPSVAPISLSSQQQQAFDQANAAYYAGVDWALDISDAAFVDVDLRGLPARLVRRDPKSQVVITREKALEGKWRNLNLFGTHRKGALELFLDGGSADVVLVAPKRSRDFRTLLAGLQLLRDAGVAEPD